MRRPLHEWLAASHAGDPETALIHELKMPRPTGRIDLAVVNGELVGFEIKSDVDSLRRLGRQAAAFNRVFDRVCLVTTDQHVSAAKRLIPQWWGIAKPNAELSGFIQLEECRPNPEAAIESLLYILNRDEIKSIASNFGVGSGTSKKTKSELIALLLNAADAPDLRQQVRAHLRLRKNAEPVFSYPSSSPPNSSALRFATWICRWI